MGVRDLSLINTAPVDRLPVRTFILKWNETTIRNAIQSEIKRGGQVYFIHNRVQSIYSLADELKQIVPEARIRVGHGQMTDDELETTMMAFYNKEIDVLVCTTIVESGVDVSSANTMFIDQAHQLGLSQLYQLRGRVGRSKQRAFCYLLTPKGQNLDKIAQERLKVIHDNTALGSGIRIAQYDLELRGAGEILGENQSGHINLVGYEMYMDLLNEEIGRLKGEDIDGREVIEPEINLRVPASIPEAYIPDIRVRLSFYKALSEIRNEQELEQIELDLKDQFGELPDAVLNLFGVMLIRQKCRTLGVKDVAVGLKNVSLIFAPSSPLKTETVIRLATRENKKYSITPDSRLNIRLNNLAWPNVLAELELLEKQV
jgi:transcription-repair coupling factor (superfamily II helicase)